MPMIVCPTTNKWVEKHYQVSSFSLFIPFYSFPDFAQERFDILLGWLDKQLAFVLTYILSEEIKALLNMCYSGFLLREFQSSGVQKLLYQGNTLLLQYLSGTACNNEVVR